MKYLEGIRWYNKGKFEPEEPFDEIPSEDLSFICIGNMSNVYVVEKQIDKNTFIFYNNYEYTFKDYKPYYPNDKEIEDIIKNIYSIAIKDGTWKGVYWKNLPEEIKDRIKC